MGRTLTSILAIGVAIAINAIPSVGAFLTATIGTALASSVTGAVTALGLASAASLLGLGGGRVKPETTETAVKTSRPPRVSAYGRSRLYGAYVLYETASNGTAVDVYAVHEGQIDGVEQYYLGDEPISLAGDTVNTGADGRYKDGAVKLYATDGSAPGAGFPAVSALIPGWTGRGDGVAAIALTAKAVKAKYFQEVYPQASVPIPSIAARWQRCPDPSVADPLDEAGWTWTENSVRHLLHYKLVREGPRPALPRSNAGYSAALLELRQAWWQKKIAPTLDYWIEAADHCDEQVGLTGGGSEARYRSCLSHKHTDAHQSVIGGLLATFDGWLAPRADGALVVYSGRFVTPTVAIGTDEILSYSFDNGGIDDDQAINEITCSYVSSEHDFNVVECDPWRDEDDIIARGKVLASPLEAAIPSHGQSRRLAKRRMARTNAPQRGTVTTNIAGRAARGQRYIDLRIEEAGTVFFDGPAEILKLSRSLSGGVTFEWVAADPDADEWNAEVEEGLPAALGERVSAAALYAPTIVSAIFFGTEEISPGVAGARIRITVLGPDRDDLTWFARWRSVGSSTWGGDLTFTDVEETGSVVIETDFVPASSEVEVQAAYQIGGGRISDWSTGIIVATDPATADSTVTTADSINVTADQG